MQAASFDVLLLSPGRPLRLRVIFFFFSSLAYFSTCYRGHFPLPRFVRKAEYMLSGLASFFGIGRKNLSSDCAPSLMASPVGCTSTINSHRRRRTPAATAWHKARVFPSRGSDPESPASAVNSFPPIARCRTYSASSVSNVRIHRSHKIKSGFPCAVIYSRDIISSFTVRLSAFQQHRPPAFSNLFSSIKFCMFRASHPASHRILATIYVASSHRLPDDRQPRHLLAFCSSFFFFHPLKLDGEVRGLERARRGSHFPPAFRHALPPPHDLFFPIPPSRPGHHSRIPRLRFHSNSLFILVVTRAKFLAPDLYGPKSAPVCRTCGMALDRFHHAVTSPTPPRRAHSLFPSSEWHLIAN